MKTIRRRAVTLVELLVVLAILAGLIGLLLPAAQRSRAAARNSVCQNNLRQISLAAQNHRQLGNKFPVPGQSWTVTLLQWMEERPLMEAIRQGNRQAAIGSRPPIFRCPSQPDPLVDDTAARTCHYTLEMNRDRKGNWIGWSGIRDRRGDFDGEQVRPWIEGPIAEPLSESDFETRGPHDGRFNMAQG